MNYASIKWHDVANGPGVRISLFVSGCSRHCPGCFNSEAWDFSYGEPFTEDVAESILSGLSPWYIRGLSILGGEPFENEEGLLQFLPLVRANYPDKDIWCWTGYQYSDVKDSPLIPLIDVLVDGPFVESLKDPRLKFRGSSNQNIIKVG